MEFKKEDKELDFWAGYLPIKTICESPINAEDLKEGIEAPKHVIDFYYKNKNGF